MGTESNVLLRLGTVFISTAEAAEGDTAEETLEEAARREAAPLPQEETRPPIIRSSTGIRGATTLPPPPSSPVAPPEPPQCRDVFFHANDYRIPAEYKLVFQRLAARAGNTDVVDSCDMDSFYEEMGVKSNKQITSPQTFMHWQIFWSEPEIAKAFDYEEFYNYLAQCVRDKYFPKIVDVKKAFRAEGQDIAQLTEASKKSYAALPKENSSPGLEELARKFVQDYPYIVSSSATYAIGYKPSVYSTRSINNIVSGAGVMAAISPNDIYALNLQFDEDQPFSEVRAKQYDSSSGDVTWYINIERDALWDAIPDAQLTGRPLDKVLADAKYEIPVETNMTREQWKRLEEAGMAGHLSVVNGMGEVVSDDTAVTALVERGIKTQIKEDAELPNWVRGIKHWWNSWEWPWNS